MSYESSEAHQERVARFLQFACWDHHTHGVSDHQMYAHAALRILRHNPEIALDSIYTAVVCGEIDEVKRILAQRPEAADEKGGARGWEPLLYLCYARFPHQKTIDNAFPIARLLLDHGANPNAFYMAGDSSYSALVGVAGEGEQDSPRQPQAEALFKLLLERGADPFDIQVLYDTHFHGHILWWLKLVYAQTLKDSRKEAWDDPEWTMLDMGGYGPGAYFILSAALENDDLELAEWALKHGASPNITRSGNPKFNPKHTLYERAKFQGMDEMAQLLVRYGAVQSDPVLEDDWAFVAASLCLDRQAVHAALEKHPEYLSSPDAISHAARLDRDDAIALLLDEGVAINATSKTNETALHHAAGNNALKAAKILIERGAEIDIRESRYNATPLGFAVHFDYRPVIELLSRHSHDVFNLAFTGNIERLREVLDEQPELARSVSRDGYTLLWWLSENEKRSLEIVNLLMEHEADPSIQSPGGTTAADWARKLGMLEVAAALKTEAAPAKSEHYEFANDLPPLDKSKQPSQDYDLTLRMILPVEMRTSLPVRLFDDTETTTLEVWKMLTACLDGDVDQVRQLVEACPSMVHCDYNYMPPLHLAVREGHLELVRYLVSRGAANPYHRTYPYLETLTTTALDRGFAEIAGIIKDALASRTSIRVDEENAKIEYRTSAHRHQLEALVGANALPATEALLEKYPDVVRDELACWGEGILALPTNRRNHEMVELLVRHGARVPRVSKWGREYFFKHYDIGKFLLENGMHPDHLNHHHTSLLHSMAQEGNIQKAKLLLEHGADLDSIDEEFKSTPLGFASRWGQKKMVKFLLESGADPNKAGSPWATPLEWARKKGHTKIESELRSSI